MRTGAGPETLAIILPTQRCLPLPAMGKSGLTTLCSTPSSSPACSRQCAQGKGYPDQMHGSTIWIGKLVGRRMKWKARTTEQVAELICGDNTEGYFRYLTGPNLTRFFRDSDTEFVHDGSTLADSGLRMPCKRSWISQVQNTLMPPDAMLRVIRLLMDSEDAFTKSHPA